MRPIIALLLRLYPASWRARYGDEFETLLRARTLGPFDVADVLLGALDAHLHLRGLGSYSEHRRGFSMSLRLGGYAAIVGGILWLVVLGGNAINDGNESGSSLLGLVVLAATVTTLVALVGLSAFQSRRHPVMVWTAFAVPAIGATVGLLGVVAMVVVGDTDAEIVAGLSAWAISTLGLLALLLGSALFAAATWLARSLSRGAAALLGIGALLLLPALAGVLGGFVPSALALPVILVAIVAFPAGWMALGVSALRVGRGPLEALRGPSM